MLKDALFRWTTRIFLPGLARNMEQEGIFRLYEGESGNVEESEYVLIEDRGAPLTVFIYSGLDALFAGEPRYEFRKQLSGIQLPFNTVFFRELRRLSYHVSPSGGKDGLAFYEAKTRELMARLGGKVTVAMGSSGGAAAALYFGSRCGMDHIVAFSPGLHINAYTSLRSQLRTYFDLPKLFREPNAYAECVLVAISAAYAEADIYRHVGKENFWNVIGAFREAGDKRPGVSVFYGDRCHFDVAQTKEFLPYPSARLCPVPTGRHNSPLALKLRGELGSALTRELSRVLAEKGLLEAPVA